MKIGGWFKDCDKIQKSVRRDPHPRVPFCDADPLFIGDKVEQAVAGGVVVLIVMFVVSVWVL